MALNVAIATETRAEYWLLRPVYRAVERQPDLRPMFIASGMHHLARFGRSIRAIRADGVRVREIRTARDGDEDSAAGRSAAAARAVAGYGAALRGTDWLIVLGDRLEMLSAAVAATALGVPIAHLHGGDVAPGARDDAIRHAITKLAHLHFPASADAARRIERLGEPLWRIKLAGAPAVDAIRGMALPAKPDLDRWAGFDTDQPFALVVQHAAGHSSRQEERFLLDTLQAAAGSFERAVVIGPGLDAGSSLLHGAIQRFVRDKAAGVALSKSAASKSRQRSKSAHTSAWAFFPTLDQAVYFGLLSRAAVLVGNSSSGIIEAGYFRTPVVDVGPRQQGRLHSTNVLHCGYGRSNVAAAIATILRDAGFRRRLARCRNLYGDGRAGETVARTLARTRIDRRLMVKVIVY